MSDRYISPEMAKLVELAEGELVKRGLIIAGGFAGYRLMAMDKDAPEIQVRECMLAFYSGAQHLFTTLMRIMDPGDEPTDADMRKMDLISRELEDFTEKVLKRMHADSVKPKGQA